MEEINLGPKEKKARKKKIVEWKKHHTVVLTKAFEDGLENQQQAREMVKRATNKADSALEIIQVKTRETEWLQENPSDDQHEDDVMSRYAKIKTKHRQDLQEIEECIREVREGTEEAGEKLERTINEGKEALQISLRSESCKRLGRRMRINIEMQAVLLNIPVIGSPNMYVERRTIEGNFSILSHFISDYVIPFSYLKKPACLCSRCWTIYFRKISPKDDGREDNVLKRLDPAMFKDNSHFSVDQRKLMFLARHAPNHSKDFWSEILFPALMLPGTNSNRAEHDCEDYFTERLVSDVLHRMKEIFGRRLGSCRNQTRAREQKLALRKQIACFNCMRICHQATKERKSRHWISNKNWWKEKELTLVSGLGNTEIGRIHG